MTEQRVFWAQALDNASPDHIEVSGKLLAAGDTGPRQAATAQVSGVTKAGRTIFSSGGVRLIVDRRRFVIEVRSSDTDHAGRIAPIVHCDEYNGAGDGTFGDAMIEEIDQFARRIGRTIPPAHREEVREALRSLRKWHVRGRRRRAAIFGTVALIMLVVLYHVLIKR